LVLFLLLESRLLLLALPRPVATATLAAALPDFRHVAAIPADGLPTFAAGCSGLLGAKFVRCAFLVCRAPALAGDLALTLRIH
jgi:hypothetical protein